MRPRLGCTNTDRAGRHKRQCLRCLACDLGITMWFNCGRERRIVSLVRMEQKEINIWEEGEVTVVRLCKHCLLIHTQTPEESLEPGKTHVGNGFASSCGAQGLMFLTWLCPCQQYPFTHTSLTPDFLRSFQKGFPSEWPW